MPYIFIFCLLIGFAPVCEAQSSIIADTDFGQTDFSKDLNTSTNMPVPFAPLGEEGENSVSEIFLEQYLKDSQNASIPADILAILQNRDSLVPPTIIRQAPSSYTQDDIYSDSSAITGKINSPYLPIINEIAKDPALLQSIPLDAMNKLILESTQNHNRNMNFLHKPVQSSQPRTTPVQAQGMSLLPYHQNFAQSTLSKDLLPPALPKMQKPYLNRLGDLEKLQVIASKNQISDIQGNMSAAENNKSQNTDLQSLDIEKTKNPQFSATDTALTAIKIEELEEKARNNDENAKIILAHAYFNGTGGHKDIDRAFKLMEENAKQGSARAMLELGKMYEEQSPRHNIMRAANYYRQASEYGNMEGKYHLALLYYKGKFGQGEEAVKNAIYAFRECAAKDHAPSMYQLATMYEKGIGFNRDMGQAVQLYRKSAHLGYANAQLQVGLLYENGILVPKNETLAAAWYTKAAEQNHPTAQYLLAGMYRQGIGVPKNLTQAKILYENTANMGLVDAQYDLGIFHLLNTEFQDYEKALFWLRKAADQGDTQAREILLQVQEKLNSPNKK